MNIKSEIFFLVFLQARTTSMSTEQFNGLSLVEDGCDQALCAYFFICTIAWSRSPLTFHRSSEEDHYLKIKRRFEKLMTGIILLELSRSRLMALWQSLLSSLKEETVPCYARFLFYVRRGGKFIFFLSLRFYVKSILERISKYQSFKKYHFCNF